MFYYTDVLVLRTGVKENDGDWMQSGSFTGCGDGEGDRKGQWSCILITNFLPMKHRNPASGCFAVMQCIFTIFL